MTQSTRHWQAFDPAWFDKHQAKLLWVCNAPIIGRLARRVFRFKHPLPLELITPDAAHFRQDDHQSIATFFTYPRHSQQLYNALKPLWWLMHWWDELVADRWIPELSFGFDQLTVYTGDSNLSVQNFDGSIRSDANIYTDARNGSGDLLYATLDSQILVENSKYATAPSFTVHRMFLKFNLSTMPINNVVTAATLKIAPIAQFQTSGFNFEIYPASMSNSSTDLQYADWTSTTSQNTSDRLINVQFSSIGPITPIDYRTLTFSATGRSYIQSKATGYLPLVGRHSRDVSGTSPTTASYATFASAENSNNLPPMLEVTYARAILPNGFAVTVTFGQPAVVGTNPIMRPNGLPVTIEFGQPALRGSAQTINLNGFTVAVTFGQPRIPIIQLNGFPVNIYFGTPRIPVIQPSGLPVNVTFGQPVVGRGRVMQLNGLGVNVTFGQPSVRAVTRTIEPDGIPVTVQFGYPGLSIPYPDGTLFSGPYIARLMDQPIDYAVTRYEFEDGGLAVNVQPCGARRWVLEYEGLSAAEITQLRNHYNAMRGRSSTFNFYHRRDQVTYTGVRYVSMTLPAREKAWSNGASVILEALA